MSKKIIAAMVLSIVLIIVGITITVWAANEPDNTIPNRINYQGYLTNEVGEPIDGPVNITFRLYDVSGGGSALWTESHSLTANKGIVNAELGGNPDPITTTILAGERWLGITVAPDSNEMVPRKRLGSTPYSFYADEANNANTLDGLDSDDFEAVGIKLIGGYCSTVAGSGYHKYCMSNIEQNTAAGYFTVAADGTFTATQSGYYRINAVAMGKPEGTSCRNVFFKVNEGIVRFAYHCDFPSTAHKPIGLDIIWPINAGDTFYVEYSAPVAGGVAFAGSEQTDRIEVTYEGPL